jgi:polyhydroxybutyrate depolymerase
MRRSGIKCVLIAVVIAAAIALPASWKRISMSAMRAGNANSDASSLASIRARPYAYRVPATIDPARSYPLVIALHGLGARGVGIERYFRLDRLVDEMGFLAAFPDGTQEAPPHRRHFWNATDDCCDFAHSGVDDVAYIDDVIADMSARFRVDPKRVFLVGHSNGGYMAYRFACDRASRVAAIVSSAGAMWTDAARCRPVEPVAVLEVHGTADEVVNYEGGHLDGSSAPLKSAHATVADWTAFDRCAPVADSGGPALDLIADEQPPLGAETTVERWSGCRGVELWTVRGGAHSPAFRQPEFARAIGEWLLAHPKP